MINATTDYDLMLIAREFYAKIRSRRLAALRDSFKSGDTRWIESAVEQHIADDNLQMTRGTPEWHDLEKALLRAEIEAIERTLERERGTYSGRPSDPLLTAPDSISEAASLAKRTGLTLS